MTSTILSSSSIPGGTFSFPQAYIEKTVSIKGIIFFTFQN
ncbi:hypothetical protein A33Q_3211 [Indibacter alkaliphilus LW1]|uniref:Uncharacterized protein n=1 Tax=Indibacter alkaliphilus (strain CCUG 57479 / KCTC 22604 / LW1) TaxID=1189612 RepID=S2DA95_INDAL|nr:hypothetical protein A33Q_3211 [Indibacter alkaliphilus LW1]